jgi:hypothetical protein
VSFTAIKTKFSFSVYTIIIDVNGSDRAGRFYRTPSFNYIYKRTDFAVE